jgi:putative transposase
VGDNLTAHHDTVMRQLIDTRAWLTVFRFPAYAPELNPVEGLWAHLKHGLGDLVACSIDQLTALAKTRLKRLQYRPGLLDAFIAETWLVVVPPT